jgi:hypothetical protein
VIRWRWESVSGRTKAERETPVQILHARGKAGGLIVVHETDLVPVAAEYRADRRPTLDAKPAVERTDTSQADGP